jgi:hypothetical protein
LVRAGDLIGQLGDPLYPRKLNALYYEFAETGVHEKLGYRSPSQGLRRNGGKGRSQPRFNQGQALRGRRVASGDREMVLQFGRQRLVAGQFI